MLHIKIGNSQQRKPQIAKVHIRISSPSLSIKEMLIKRTLRYNLPPAKMSKIKNTNEILCWREFEEMGTFFHCWWDCKIWKSLWQFLRKMDNRQPQDPEILILGTYPKVADTHSNIYVHSSIICKAKTTKQNTWP